MNNANEPAFPLFETAESTNSLGLSKREYIAAMALQGLLANPHPGTNAINAKMAIEVADELLKQLNP